jgi:hypothetical protein
LPELRAAERDRVDVRDRERLGLVRRRGEVRAGSSTPKKFGCWKITQAASAAASPSSSGSVAPARCGTSTTSSPKPGA